jgi:hypothetical protein
MNTRFMIGLALMLASAVTFSIKATESLPEVTRMPNVGGFPYSIGEGFGSDKASSFINFINSASTLYRDDYKQNLFYVHACMTAAYPSDGDFGIIIQGDSASTKTDSFIYGSLHGTGTGASFSAGINMINPSWSYYVYFLDKSDDRQVEYIPPLGRGTGIDDARAEKLNQVIKKNDGIICKCNQVWLFDDLSKSDGQGWNEVCHSGPISHAYVPVRKSQWMATRPGPCYYIIYVQTA